MQGFERKIKESVMSKDRITLINIAALSLLS